MTELAHRNGRTSRGSAVPAIVQVAGYPVAARDDACVHDLVRARARSCPAAVALTARGRVVTYGTLEREAVRLAGRLRSLGVGPEVPVGLCVERSPALAVGALGILSAGGAYVALDASYPEDRLEFMLRDSGAPIVVTQAGLAPRLGACAAAKVLLDEDAGPPADGRGPRGHVTSDNLAYIIYTSGSTGRPKGVMIEHGSLMNLVRWYLEAFAVTAADRASQVVSPAFDAAVMELWPPLVAGASVHFADESIRADPGALCDWLVDESVTIAVLPAPLAEMALDLPWPSTTRLRTLLTGGDVLHRHPPPGLPFAFVNSYGPTEGTVVATSIVLAPDGSSIRPPSIGRPIRNCRLHVVDGDLRPVEVGSPGELLIGGAGLARGYLHAPELTAERFIEDPFSGEPGARVYRTGDLARQRPGGELEFLGRLDDQVKIRGFRIEPGEIAAALDAHLGVRCSTVRERKDGHQRLVAYLVPRGSTRPEPDELRRHLQRLLPPYMVPSDYVYLRELPLTANGKVDRAALPAPEQTAGGAGGRAPRNDVERELGEMVATLLGLERVDPDQDFLRLGGYSLMAAQLVAAIHRRFEVAIPLITVFQSGTVAGLAAAVEHLVLAGQDAAGSAGEKLAVVAQRSGSRPALFFVVTDESGLAALHHFIKALGDDQPVIGLVPPRRGRRFDRHLTVTDLAARQVPVIQKQQPHGPYCLCGHSLGGLLAYEVAGQLRGQGEEVAWVGLLDTMVPAASRLALARNRRLGKRLRLLRSRAALVGLPAMLREVGGRRAERLRASLGLPLLPDQFDSPGAYNLTVTYRVVGHDAPLDVFATNAGRLEAGSSALGWEGLHRGPLHWHAVEGDHHTVLHEPDPAAIGLIVRRLQEAQQSRAERARG